MEMLKQIGDVAAFFAAGWDLRSLALGLVTIFATAYATNLFFHRANLKLAKRNEKLDRLNRQLGDLYGPLRMLRYAGETGFRTFKAKYFPNRPELFWQGVEPSEEDYAAWRVWLKHTLMPVNKQIENLLLEHGDLIDGTEIPQPVLDFFAHVSTLEAVIAQWDQGNFKDFKSGIQYPVDFNRHIDDTYKKLLRARKNTTRA